MKTFCIHEVKKNDSINCCNYCLFYQSIERSQNSAGDYIMCAKKALIGRISFIKSFDQKCKSFVFLPLKNMFGFSSPNELKEFSLGYTCRGNLQKDIAQKQLMRQYAKIHKTTRKTDEKENKR